MAVEKMVTTIRLDEFISNRVKTKNKEKLLELIGVAIKGGLIELNESSGEIRFIHHRFQEFFSSSHILNNYHKSTSVLPKNAFTNIWWKETILFIAGLEDDVSFLIDLIIKQKNSLTITNKTAEKLLKVDMLTLAFECMFSNLAFSAEIASNKPSKSRELYETIRGDLVDAYNRGNTLQKVKIITVLKYDKSRVVLELMEKALKDRSHWVSERGFFVLSGGDLRIQMTPRAILSEFFRFFTDGRIINTFVPVIKSATKSTLMRVFLPLYLILLVTNMLAIVLVGYVFYSFIEFILFKLEIAFTSECLQCLATITLGAFIIIYSLVNNNYPVLKRFLYVAPLALVVKYLVFSIPSNFIYKLVMMALGWLAFGLYGRYIKRPNESNTSVGSITAFVFGFAILVPLFNRQVIQQIIETSGQTVRKAWDAIAQIFRGNEQLGSTFTSIASLFEGISPYLAFIALIVAFIFFAVYVYRQTKLYAEINKQIIKTENILAGYSTSQLRASKLSEQLNNLSVLWAQKFLLRRSLEIMTHRFNYSREQKMDVLDHLAEKVNSVDTKDLIYQSLEQEENNFRRNI
jgi:hypothetical protein